MFRSCRACKREIRMPVTMPKYNHLCYDCYKTFDTIYKEIAEAEQQSDSDRNFSKIKEELEKSKLEVVQEEFKKDSKQALQHEIASLRLDLVMTKSELLLSKSEYKMQESLSEHYKTLYNDLKGKCKGI